ncbi:MAG: SNF2-related protein [Candidatus Xenobia bacterium]
MAGALGEKSRRPMAMKWVPQQRVVNEAEPSLGLGRVRRMLDQRTVEIEFPAAGTVRAYNVQTAPLRRVRLQPGQQARVADGRHLRIAAVHEVNGLFTYEGAAGERVAESDLADEVPAEHAAQQLLAGHLAPVTDYPLRKQGWQVRQEVLSGEVRGLVGARVRLLPHQLYIASRVAGMERPRVVLADEVGLGKTIEACLIFCALRATGRADRVLVLTPPSLVHQWLAEMYRRFHELFTVLDEERCEAMDEGAPPSPFQQVSRVICSIDLLASDPQRLEEAVAARWDLVIVDEAHHLRWSQQGHSASYEAVRRLAEVTDGLLLLTATPLRSGLSTEYGLLRLVDAERFPDFGRFCEDQRRLREVAVAARALTAHGLTPELMHTLHGLFPADTALHELLAAQRPVREIVAALIDRHGTGRVLIRNRRERLHGFPERVLHPHPMPREGRFEWLVDFVREHAEEKLVLIVRTPADVLALQEAFRKSTGLNVAVFHEGLSQVERDRQAAWFAELEGAAILLCSEIGGEGRNFQFSHHLIMYDLPLHPDVLEQRIGRLDRIGQTEAVNLHVPYAVGTEEEALFRWFHEGLDAFHNPVSGGEAVMEVVEPELMAVLENPQDQARLAALMTHTREVSARVAQEVQDNVDDLVDLNSFDEAVGRHLVETIEAIDRDVTLREFMTRVFERFGVVEDDLDATRLVLRTDMMFVDAFPGLPSSDPLQATWDRETALVREDIDFLSRDHPVVEGGLGLLLDLERNAASAALWQDAPAAGLWLSLLFVLEATGPVTLSLPRYLPITPVELVASHRGELGESLPEGLVRHKLERLGADSLGGIAGWLTEQLPRLLSRAEAKAGKLVAGERQAAIARARSLMESELARRQELARVNAAVAPSEMARFHTRMVQTMAALEAATLRLDSIQLIVARKAERAAPGTRRPGAEV